MHIAAAEVMERGAEQRTGDRLGALRALVNMELREPSEPGAPIAHLHQLLAQARAAGNVTLEPGSLTGVFSDQPQ